MNPTINGSNLFTASSINNTVATLSWSAPSGISPYGYQVMAIQVIAMQDIVEFLDVGTYGTAKTSITLPPLIAGNTYLFTIVTDVDGAASMETSPYRSQLPTGFATVISGLITVNTGASQPVLRGDAKAWERFFHRKGKPYRTMATGK